MNVWPIRNLTFYLNVQAPGLETARFRRIYLDALSRIEAVCGVTFAEVTDASAANIVAVAGSIDGPGKDLALTELPGPGIRPDSTLRQTFDAADLAAEDDNELLVECLHEDGHFLGRPHSPPGVSSVMSEYIDTTLTGLTSYDEAQLQAMYGPPAPVASPPAAPATPFALGPVTIAISGVGTYTLTVSDFKPA